MPVWVAVVEAWHHATPRLRQLNACVDSYIPASSTPVISQCRSQVISSRARYTSPLLRDLHWLRSRERIDFMLAFLSMQARSRSLISLWSFPTCRQLQPLTSSFIVIIIVVADPTNTTSYSRWPCISGGRKPSLEQSAARRHSAPTLAVYRNWLKTFLFSRSFSHWLTLIHRLVVYQFLLRPL